MSCWVRWGLDDPYVAWTYVFLRYLLLGSRGGSSGMPLRALPTATLWFDLEVWV